MNSFKLVANMLKKVLFLRLEPANRLIQGIFKDQSNLHARKLDFLL